MLPSFLYSFTFKYTTANQYLGVNIMLQKAGTVCKCVHVVLLIRLFMANKKE